MRLKIKKLLSLHLTLCLISIIASSCSGNEPESTPQPDSAPLIILDTDIGSSTDDLFALEMLYRYHEKGRCKLLGIVVDREGENCAAITDLMNTYFNHPDIPIGLIIKGIPNPKVWNDYSVILNLTKNDGRPLFDRNIDDYSSLPDGWQLYRRLLAAQPDNSVSICSIGFVTSLSQLLESEPDDISPLNGVQLVRRKVKCLYIMGGQFGESEEPDYNLKQGISFARVFFDLWPSDVDIIFSPQEVGQRIKYPHEQVIADIDWTDAHPIKQVYLCCKHDTGQRMWDPLTVINAIEGNQEFTLSPRGTVAFSTTGETTFTPNPKGNCRYQLPDSHSWNNYMLEIIRKFNMIK